MSGAANLCRGALLLVRRSWRPLLAAHGTFVALGFVVFAPLTGIVGRLLLHLSDQPALADQDIAYFLLSPLGMLALIVFAALSIGIMAFEQAALMRIGVAAMQRQKIGVVEVLSFTAWRVRDLFLFSARLVTRVLMLTLPFLVAAAAIAFFLLTDYDINYYLTEKPPAFWTAAGLIAAVLVAMAALLVRKLLDWSLALPLVLFADASAAGSFGASARIMHGGRATVLTAFAAWAAVALLLGGAVFVVIRLIGSWTVPGASGSLPVLVVLLGGLSMLWVLGNFVATTFTSGSFAYLVMGVFERRGPRVDPQSLRGGAAHSPSGALRVTPAKMAAAVVAAVAAAGAVGVWLVDGIRFDDDVTIVAHRGAAGKAPENTLAAVDQAIVDDADWVEIDVQETADGEVVVIHDSDFMKLSGNPTKVWDTTLSQVREIDVGSWFDTSFSEERVPTLAEVLERTRGKAKVVIELKYYGHDENLEQRVVDIVEESAMVDETAIMSLKYDAVRKVRALRPHWRVGLLSATAIGDLTALDADFLAVAMGMASRGLVARAHEAGKQVFVWTVNDPVSLSRMMSLGVDGVITDEPEMARRVLADRAQMNSAERLLIHTTLLFGQSFTPQRYRDDSP